MYINRIIDKTDVKAEDNIHFIYFSMLWKEVNYTPVLVGFFEKQMLK